MWEACPLTPGWSHAPGQRSTKYVPRDLKYYQVNTGRPGSDGRGLCSGEGLKPAQVSSTLLHHVGQWYHVPGMMQQPTKCHPADHDLFHTPAMPHLCELEAKVFKSIAKILAYLRGGGFTSKPTEHGMGDAKNLQWGGSGSIARLGKRIQ